VHRAHRLDERAARWLLQVDERVDEAPFEVTQEFLAEMIGTQRPSVSLAVRQFKDAGLITYSRGQIAISDREGLLKRSCACITVMHAEEERLRDTVEHPVTMSEGWRGIHVERLWVRGGPASLDARSGSASATIVPATPSKTDTSRTRATVGDL
jgi:hypothetical protein